MHHLYLSLHNNAAALQQERESLVARCEANGVKEYTWIEDKNVLYGKEDTLRQLHSQGLSPQKIANALGVSRGTVYNYIVENG